MREAFALQKLFTLFQQKYRHILDISIRNLNETLTNDIISFEQLGPGKKKKTDGKIWTVLLGSFEMHFSF